MEVAKTLEGIEGMLYIMNGLSGDEFEDYFNEMMFNYCNDVVLSAMELRAAWLDNANSPTALAIEKEVANLMGIEQYYSPYIKKIREFSNKEKEAVRAIYDTTQKLLKLKKVKDVILYRGMSWIEAPEWAQHAQVGDLIILRNQRVLSSWSFSEDVAKGFMSRNFGILIKAQMSADRIFAIIDLMNGAESVCISHQEDSEFEVVFIKGGEQNEQF